MTRLTFPPGFLWGAATSSYQIEGAAAEDGRGASIWDAFCRQPGRTLAGATGDVAADHYHRWREDLDLAAALGLTAYRFSVAWPRIQPQGSGPANPAGLGFYERLVDGLLERGIQPWLCLYHWDLPLALQERGGWPKRETAEHFADYAGLLAARLGDRVTRWITHNEPLVAAGAGYLLGEHAPGIRDPLATARAGHHLLLSHGLAARAIRANAGREVKVGIVLNLSPVEPATQSKKDLAAARRHDLLANRLMLESLLLGRTPLDEIPLIGPALRAATRPGDAETVHTLDFLGVNYYTRSVVRHDPKVPLLAASEVRPQGNEYSAMWEIHPPGLHDLLLRVWNDYLKEHPAPPELFVTENGVPVPDGIDLDGRVRDERRIRYIRDHLSQVRRAINAGVPVRGYFVWSLLDNFEWALGYGPRFGLVYVDYETQRRIVKDSGRWYAQVIRENGFEL